MTVVVEQSLVCDRCRRLIPKKAEGQALRLLFNHPGEKGCTLGVTVDLCAPCVQSTAVHELSGIAERICFPEGRP